jgi:hypothetical protein
VEGGNLQTIAMETFLLEQSIGQKHRHGLLFIINILWLIV